MRRRLVVRIDIVPYIDVLLVLLVVFMITAPLMNQGVVSVPSMSRPSSMPDIPIRVTLAASGRYQVTMGREHVEVSLSDLVATVRRMQQTVPHRGTIVIAAEQHRSYQQVMRVLDVLQQAGFMRVGLLVATEHGS